jgi:hypothetical protein
MSAEVAKVRNYAVDRANIRRGLNHTVPDGWNAERTLASPIRFRDQKTGRPVRFELTEVARQALDDYLA